MPHGNGQRNNAIRMKLAHDITVNALRQILRIPD
jgi:hypothetical protein